MAVNECASESKPITCGICGGATVTIRPRVPMEGPRLVCPTCLADRMDDIQEISGKMYGVTFAAEPATAEAKDIEP